MKYFALLRRLVAKPEAPSPKPAPAVVHRGETVFSNGCGR